MKVTATIIQTNRVIYTLKKSTGNETTPSQVTRVIVLKLHVYSTDAQSETTGLTENWANWNIHGHFSRAKLSNYRYGVGTKSKEVSDAIIAAQARLTKTTSEVWIPSQHRVVCKVVSWQTNPLLTGYPVVMMVVVTNAGRVRRVRGVVYGENSFQIGGWIRASVSLIGRFSFHLELFNASVIFHIVQLHFL